MSKKSGCKNRVCLKCRIKYPGAFTNDSKHFNITSVCSECGGELTDIPDSVRVPRKHQVRLWRKLEQQVKDGEIERPLSEHSITMKLWDSDKRHMILDGQIRGRAYQRELRENIAKLYQERPDEVDKVLNYLNSLPDPYQLHFCMEEVIQFVGWTYGNDLRTKSKYEDWIYDIKKFWELGYKIPDKLRKETA